MTIYRMVLPNGSHEFCGALRAFEHTHKPEPDRRLQAHDAGNGGWVDVEPEPKALVMGYFDRRHDRETGGDQ